MHDIFFLCVCISNIIVHEKLIVVIKFVNVKLHVKFVIMWCMNGLLIKNEM
jgi:hypothetical protein